MVLSLCFLAPMGAAAQAPFQEPAAGTRVRLHESTGRTWEGRWVRRSPDSVYLAVVGPIRPDTVAVRRDAIERLERQVGTRSQARKGALIGGGVGGGLLLLLGLAATSGEDNWVDPGTGDIAILTGLGALVGAGTGALIGAASHAPVWAAFELPPPIVPPAGPRQITLFRLTF
ncbi:MAG TPA: hypothetical protein VLA95_02740 [Gemmatimonadales bacterium]|nr:hypothetical protein [Gemmatimonadales bacterium]